MLSPYARPVKAGSGAKAVQVVYSSWRGVRDIERIDSARDVRADVLEAVARQCVAGTDKSHSS
jgi:hypothetical protein